MEKLIFRPEKEQRTLWIITWAIVFIIGTPIWIMIPFLAGEQFLLFGIFILIWFIVMVLVIFWIPAAFRALEYTIDSDGVKMKGGVVWKKYVTVPYSKITNVDITRGPLQRYYNIGTIHVQTAGAAGKQGEKAELKLSGIRDLEKVREVIIQNIKDPSYHAGNFSRQAAAADMDEKTPVLESILEELRNIKDIMKKN